MAFCELLGDCIWSCCPGGKCADKESTSCMCVRSTPLTRTWVGNRFSEELDVVVGIHQRSALSRLFLIIVLEAASRKFHTGCPLELLYAKYLMISAESIEELLAKLKTWKSEMEKKGLWVNDYGDWH